LFPREAHYLFTEAKNPRALPAQKLMEIGNQHGLKGSISANVNEAIKEARLSALESDFILITGSTYLVAEID
jgi:dihydrofolate synthase/folylpolyglutamate synthase